MRQQKHTILIYCEGRTDADFVRYLKKKKFFYDNKYKNSKLQTF